MIINMKLSLYSIKLASFSIQKKYERMERHTVLKMKQMIETNRDKTRFGLQIGVIALMGMIGTSMAGRRLDQISHWNWL